MKKLILAVLCLVATGTALAETQAFQASFTPEVAVHDKETRINGFTINFWGQNPQSALAIGLVNGSTGNSHGFSFFPWIGAFLNYAENYTGVHWGWVNWTSGQFVGWQSGIFNYSENMVGAQTGIVNYAQQVTGLQWGIANGCQNLNAGLQLGFANYAKTVQKGLQIGLVNIIPENEWFNEFPQELAKGMVICNWNFGGSTINALDKEAIRTN